VLLGRGCAGAHQPCSREVHCKSRGTDIKDLYEVLKATEGTGYQRVHARGTAACPRGYPEVSPPLPMPSLRSAFSLPIARTTYECLSKALFSLPSPLQWSGCLPSPMVCHLPSPIVCVAVLQLKKFPHLVGNYGGPWQWQKMDFAQFPGPILGDHQLHRGAQAQLPGPHLHHQCRRVRPPALPPTPSTFIPHGSH